MAQRGDVTAHGHKDAVIKIPPSVCAKTPLFHIFLFLLLTCLLIQPVFAKTAQEWDQEGNNLDNSGNHLAALAAYDQALAMNPNFAQAWYDKGVVLGKLGSNKEALVAYNKATEIDLTYEFAWANKGIILRKLGRYQESIEAFDTAISLDSNDSIAYQGKGNTLQELGKYSEALVNYERSLSIEPNYVDAWHGKGNALYDLKRYNEALNAYNTALKFDPKFVASLVGKANVLDDLGNSQEALNLYDQALSIDPNDENTQRNRAIALSHITQKSSQPTQTRTPIPIAPSPTVASPVVEQFSPISFFQSNFLPIIFILLAIIVVLFVIELQKTKKMLTKTNKDTPLNNESPEKFRINDSTEESLPQQFYERYKELHLIGKGGFARVFKATRTDGKQVAIKIPISLDASTGKSFIAELQNWTKLDHPNIVRVFDYNIMPLPYFEMELCDVSLAEEKIPMDCEEAAWIVFHICEGLKYAHARSIAHRDLKPQNILLKDNIPKISDWGLSRIISESTSTTTGSFTPYYAAPEQVNNKAKDERTDIWQLGVILYELTTGTLPFKGDSVVEVVVNISTKPYTPPSELNPDTKQIEPIISMCLEKDPNKRFQAVAALQTALGMYLRKNYAELFRQSVSVKDTRRSAYYVGDLIIVNLIIGDLNAAYKYSTDLVEYSKGDAKVLAQELCEHLYIRIQNDVTEVPDELLKKAEFVVHKVLRGF